MKRGRRTTQAPAPAAAVTPEIVRFAEEKLREDYVGFVGGTAAEDPKRFVARSAAAREALEHLAQLRALSGQEPDAEEAEPSTEEVLAAARAGMADENKS